MLFLSVLFAALCPGLLQGCGLITYKDRGSAGAAIQQLHGEYIFPGSDCPMVVEWMDLKKQRPAGTATVTLFLGVNSHSRWAAVHPNRLPCQAVAVSSSTATATLLLGVNSHSRWAAVHKNRLLFWAVSAVVQLLHPVSL